jgi:hypothetical protein
MRQQKGSVVEANFEWIAIISFINILVSVAFFYKYYSEVREFIWSIPQLVQMYLGERFGSFVPGGQPAGTIGI